MSIATSRRRACSKSGSTRPSVEPGSSSKRPDQQNCDEAPRFSCESSVMVVSFVGAISRHRLLSNSEALRHSDELGEGLCTHLPHYIAAVNLDRDLTEAEPPRNLLVHESRGHQSHY